MTSADTSTSDFNAMKYAFDPEMLKTNLDWILSHPPFAHMDFNRFPQGTASITKILQQDSRVRHFSSGDVILRHGEYSNSAFIVLRGSVQVMLEALEIDIEEHRALPQLNVWQRLVASVSGGSGNPFRRTQRPQVRTELPQLESNVAIRNYDDAPQIYLKDTDAVLRGAKSHPLLAGAIFAEMAAMTRSPSEYTAIARESTTVLEIRWQGLRQLRRDLAFRKAIDDRYRESALQTWLRNHPLLQYCPSDAIQAIAAKADLISYGEREWFVQYKQDRSARTAEQIAAEPLICSEGEMAESLYIVRSGFARRSYQFGDSHRTLSYLAQGQVYGFDEICHNARLNQEALYLPYQYSLRALGYLDIIKIDRATVMEHVIPFCRREYLPPAIDEPRLDRFGMPTRDGQYQPIDDPKAESLLEFMVENRLVNARQAMVINTDRCTRCDDCIRACAAGHQGISRFSRTGVTVGNFQFVESCMHCVDPVCMIGCPTGAITRNAETGVVSVNEATCIGCKTCADSCPYSNIVMELIESPISVSGKSDPEQPGNAVPLESGRLIASKCDLCQRLSSGPACVRACPHEALERVDLSDTVHMQTWLKGQSVRII